MINFGWAHIEGFGPIDNEDFNWGIPGLNLIQAPNGYGKTKFINALVWCLFGNTLSGSVKKWDHLTSSSYHGVKVSQELTIGEKELKITRHMGYGKFKNSLIVEIDGEEQDGEKRELQRIIEHEIGYSYDLFKASIVFGQKLKRIISETGPNKKRVFDEAFEITYLPKAKKIAEGKRDEFRQELNDATLSLTVAEGEVENCKSKIELQEQLIANFENDKKQAISDLEKKIDFKKEILKGIIKSLDESTPKADLLHEKEIFGHDMYSEDEILELERSLATNRSTLKRAKEDKIIDQGDIDDLKTKLLNVPQSCPNCGKSYNKSEVAEEEQRINDKIEKIEKRITNLNKLIKKLNRQISEGEESISSAQSTVKTYKSLTKELEELEIKESDKLEVEELIKDYKKRIKEIKKKTLETSINEDRVELTELEANYKAKKKTWRKVDNDVKTYEWLISDPLSNSGLKAFIFNAMLDAINERLEYYTKFIGFQVAFFIDMKSARKDLETYVFQGEDPVPYSDLSGGQQQAVDIAAAFAIHDVVSDSKSCSLLVMDEVFESLDKDNIEIMSEVIQDKATNKCLYLVTHLSEFNPTNANIIEISYTNGVTSLS